MAEKKQKLSPMMEHYLKVKENYKDCILFYRLGDFYEMFFEDAKKASELLDLTLTGRDCGLEERAPMCGIPYHAADTYIAKLVSLGEKVAICEQLSDPKDKAGKEIVDRDVIRVVSAGTQIEEELLDAKKNNYVLCAAKKDEGIAFAYADITTGEFYVEEAENEETLVSRLFALSPAEIIVNDKMLFALKDRAEVERGALPKLSCYLPWAFEKENAERNIKEQLGVASMEAAGLFGAPLCVVAAGALIAYLNETQKRFVKNIERITRVRNSEYLLLDRAAIRNLDLVKNNAEGKTYGSLLWVLDQTKTGMGARKLAGMITSPLFVRERIERRLDAVEELFNATVVRMGLMDSLAGVGDIERLTGRIGNGNLRPRDCLALSKSLAMIPAIKFQLAGFHSDVIRSVSSGLADTKEICALIDRAISPDAPPSVKDGGYIRAGYNEELDSLKNIKDRAKNLLMELEVKERERTGIRTLKIGYNRVFGYYIEVSNGFKDMVPYEYTRRQTLAGGERYTTKELTELERRILGSDEDARRLEAQLYSDLVEILTKNISVFRRISEAIATLDCCVALATVAKENKYCRPQISEDGALIVKDGRHPVIEAISRERFVPNDCNLDGGENRTMIITGPNMAGKSTYLRQVALIVLMAHMGSFVPAAMASVPLCDRIFTRIGASDNLILDRSTFMVEMTEVAAILRGATEKSLLILDEVGRGTSTYDGLSLAWAIIEYLTEKVRAKTLFATHYHELTELEGKLEGAKNYKINVREIGGSIVFLRKIVRGGAEKSFGVEVASLAGVPKEVTERAKKLLKSLEKADVTKRSAAAEEASEEDDKERFDANEELKGLDVNGLTPLQALQILSDWSEKLK